MAFACTTIDLMPADMASKLLGDDFLVSRISSGESPVFRVINPFMEQLTPIIRSTPKLSLSRTRDRFSMMTEGLGT